jgi:beta-glucanase (GH16 family)
VAKIAEDIMKQSILLLLALSAAPLANAQVASAPVAPTQAVAVGYTNLVFDDEFNTNSVSPDGTGSYNWYATNATSPATTTLPGPTYSILGGYLAINTDNSGYSDGLQSANPQNTTNSWQHGYFEASILFCQYCSNNSAWPAFWSSSTSLLTGQVPIGGTYPELDFMEYYTAPVSAAQAAVSTQPLQGIYTTTVHEWTNTSPATSVQNPNNVPVIPPGTDFSMWHTYGCLWTPNQVQWYFDNQLVTTVATGPGTPFPSLELSKMYLILGSGAWWPMYVDYVHVWQ